SRLGNESKQLDGAERNGGQWKFRVSAPGWSAPSFCAGAPTGHSLDRLAFRKIDAFGEEIVMSIAPEVQRAREQSFIVNQWVKISCCERGGENPERNCLPRS